MSESRKRGRGGGGPGTSTTRMRIGSGGILGPTSIATTATTTASSAVVARNRVESADDRVRAAQLRDPKQRIKALNAILKLTSSHETNHALTGDSITNSLVHIALECIHWNVDQPPPQCRRRRRRKAQEKDNEEEEGGRKSITEEEEDTTPMFSSFQTWEHPPTKAMRRWVSHWRTEFEDDAKNRVNLARFRTLEVIVAIWRNLSFVGANLRLLVYTPAVVSILVGCLYENHRTEYGAAAAAANEPPTSSSQSAAAAAAASSSSAAAAAVDSSNAATEEAMKVATSRIQLQVNAMQTLIHLAPYIDVSGLKLLTDKLFYAPSLARDGPMVPDPTTFGQTASGNCGFGGLWLAKRLDTKEDTLSTSANIGEFLLDYAGDYLVAVWSIFSGLAHVLTNPSSPRAVLLVALDLLQELISQAGVGVVGTVQLHDQAKDLSSLPTLRAILVSLPDSMLSRLVDLLHVPRVGPNSMEYFHPLHNVVTRETTLKSSVTYDAAIDTDLRDRTLDVLVPLLDLDSPRMAIRLGDGSSGVGGTRLWDALVPILTCTSGRNEATVLAAQLFRELAKAKSHNRPGLQYVQSRLVELASRDNRVAHLVWNHLFPPGVVSHKEEDTLPSAASARSIDEDAESSGLQDASGADNDDG